MSHERQLKRADNACDIPPHDRAIAMIVCKLIMAQDRVTMDSCFFSRALAACNGALVWPETVLREMGKDYIRARTPSKPIDGSPPRHRRAVLHQIRLPIDLQEDSFVSAGALVNPDRLLEVRSTCFGAFSTNALHRLMVAQATIAWLVEAPDPTESIPILRNATYMAHAFAMDECGASLFRFMCIVMNSEPLKLTLCTINCLSMHTAVDILTRWLGSGKRSVVEEFFTPNGMLVQIGLHAGMEAHTCDLEDAMRLSNPLICSKLQQDHASKEVFFDSFLNASSPAALTTQDIPHLIRSHALNRSLLANAAIQQTPGVNVLLYGQPGTGKTQYARLLAQEAGLKLYEIESRTPQGTSAQPGQRLGTLMVALRALSHHANAAVLFDEAEDLFEPSSLGDNHRSSKLSKAWLNQFLETTTVPVIWTSNLISHMEPSVLRRFMVLQEFRTPPANVRLKMAQKHLLPLGLDMMDVRAIADLPMLTPAQIELTAKTIHLASPNGVTEARAWTNHHLASSRRALGHSIGSNRHPVDVQFDPRYLNTRNGPSVDKLLQHMEADPAISLCLYGLPGTGKTEFARYLAQQLGRELVVRSASDLLSKWVGDTEQKIAAMFEECADYPHETVLLLDEADTFLRNRLTARSTWEVSHTNEFLARMALFPGTFICTTNLFEELDCAVLRRFQFRVQFDAMKPEQVNALFEATFEMKVPVDFSKLTGLVPADFSNVKRQLKFLDGEYDVKALLDLLQVESITRKGQSLTKASIGFL